MQKTKTYFHFPFFVLYLPKNTKTKIYFHFLFFVLSTRIDLRPLILPFMYGFKWGVVVRLSNIFILRFAVALPLIFPSVIMIIFCSNYLTEGAHSL